MTKEFRVPIWQCCLLIGIYCINFYIARHYWWMIDFNGIIVQEYNVDIDMEYTIDD